MKKTVRVMLAAILAFTLSLGIVPAAYADPVDPTTINTAAITKVLKVPVGTEYPAMTFSFTVTPIGFADTTNTTGMPAIGPVSIAFDGATAVGRSEVFDGTVAGVSTYYLESAELFGSVTWPTTGKYDYLVVETGTNYVIADNLHEAMDFSLAQYQLSVFVREYNADDLADGVIPAGKSVGELYIYAIGMVRVVGDDGEPSGFKGDPTPGGNGITTHYSDMIFTNKYVKTNGAGDPEDPKITDPAESTLNVTKTVDGVLGSYTLPFDFFVSINVPTLIPSYVLSYYKAYLVDATGALDPTGTVNATLIGTDSSGLKFIKFAPGATVAFQLTHGQKLVFVNTPVGTSYSFTETGELGYISSVRITNNGVQGAPNAGLVGDGIGYANALVGEAYNSADVTNLYDITPPAGLSMNNLPFYTLVLLALGALFAFIVLQRRKRQEEI